VRAIAQNVFQAVQGCQLMRNLRETPAAYIGKGMRTSIGAARILLVEDNETNRQNFEEFLDFWGYQVFSMANGSSLFQALADFQPHLIWLDLKLPDVDGYTLLEQLQQSSHWQHIPVIIVSALASKADQKRARSLGAIQYLVKPTNLDDLQQAIQEGIALTQAVTP
jgi:two-component system cell cycle response regulator DivK